MNRTLTAIMLSGAALSLSVGGASAADIIPPGPDWTGAWIGAGVGGQIGVGDASASAEWDQSGFPTEIDQSPFADGSISSTSFLGTVGAGFDYQFGSSFVLGIFGDYTFAGNESSSISGGSDGYLDQNNGPDGDYGSIVELDVGVGNNWTIGGRIGFLATESTMIYGLVGYTQADAEWDWYSGAYEDVATSGWGDAWAGESEWIDGVTFGGGVETMLTENLSAKLEYRYTDLGSVSSNSNTSVEVDSEFYDLDSGDADADIVLHSVRATVSWRF